MAEFVEVMKQAQRMCSKHAHCDDCPLDGNCIEAIDFNAEEYELIIMQWAKDHPEPKPKTMMEDFFEKFPDAPKNDEGTPDICPYEVGYEKKSICPIGTGKICLVCWSRPLPKVK